MGEEGNIGLLPSGYKTSSLNDQNLIMVVSELDKSSAD